MILFFCKYQNNRVIVYTREEAARVETCQSRNSAQAEQTHRQPQ